MVTDREFIDAAAKGLEIEAEPFNALAGKLGITVEEVLSRISRLISENKVRRFSASVRHQPMGYEHNAMVIARTDEAGLEAAGEAAAAIEAVSHCYHRSHPDGYPWCVYIMVHGMDEKTVAEAIGRIRNIPRISSLEILASREELKKTSLSGVSTDLDNLP